MNVIIGLNVGGQCYKTTRETLTRFSESVLGSKFNEKVPKEKDIDGNFCIDRDGPLFRYVLNFLRDKKLALPADFCEFEQLTLEAEYYRIPGLLEAVRQAERNSACVQSTTYLTAEHVTDTDTEKQQWQVMSSNIDVLWKLSFNLQTDSDAAPKKLEEKQHIYCVEFRNMAQKTLFQNIWNLGFSLNIVTSGEQQCYEFVKRT